MDAGITAVNMSADARIAVPASADGTLIAWDVRTRRVLGRLVGHSGRVNGVALNPAGDLAVSVSADGHVIVWNAARRAALIAASTYARNRSCP